MNYYDNIEAFQKRGIDYDLDACLQYNPQEGFTILDIKQVVAEYEGENDGESWRWIMVLHDDRIIYLRGSCDYTGWDCQSWAEHTVVKTFGEAAACEDDVDVRANLIEQLNTEKALSWREKMDQEMGEGQ